MVCLVVEIVYENILTFTVLNMLGYNVAIWIVLDVPYVCFCIAYLGSQVYVVDMRRLSIICHFMFYTTLVLLVKRKLPNVSETSSMAWNYVQFYNPYLYVQTVLSSGFINISTTLSKTHKQLLP